MANLTTNNPLIDQAAESLKAIGQGINNDQKLYLDGFMMGLQSKGVSFGDFTVTPGNILGHENADRALHQIAMDKGDMTEDEAKVYIEQLKDSPTLLV
ncbi:MAG: hypothetical protein AAF984_07085 [Verrucomicrobiota bacterium]